MAALPKITLKAQIPEELKAEVAQTPWGKVLSVTPVVMTVIATMLAGLASSEMTRAQAFALEKTPLVAGLGLTLRRE